MTGARAYVVSQVESATPLQRVVMLYDGAIRFLESSSEHMARRDFESATLANIRAQNILVELKKSLDYQKGGEPAALLRRFYVSHLQRLVQANMRRDAAIIDQVIGALRDMREGWAALESDGAVAAV
jgi:flagellar protein FliS